MEAAKGVVWDHGECTIKGQKLHKYVLVTVLITDEEIPVAVTNSHELHAGQDPDNQLTKAVTHLFRKYPAPYAVGDACDVLCRMGDWKPPIPKPKRTKRK